MKKNTKRVGSLTKLINNFNSPKISEMQNLESNQLENFINANSMGVQRSAVAAAISRSNNTNALMTQVQGDFRAPASAAQMNFLVTRLTANIALTLYVPLFGALDRESDYLEVLSGVVPSGVTWTVERNADRKSLNFVFVQTAGGATDTVVVSCNEVPYVNYILGMLQNVIQLSQIKLQISDVARQTQFSLSHLLIDNSQYGADRSDKFTPNSFKSDLQNQNDIRTINSIMDFDAEKALVVPITNAAAFTYTINAFVSKYDKSSSRI